MTLFNIVYILSNIVIIIEKLNSDPSPPLMIEAGYNSSVKREVAPVLGNLLPLRIVAGTLDTWNFWHSKSQTNHKPFYDTMNTSNQIPEATKDRVLMWSLISNLCFVAGLIMDCCSFIALMSFLSSEPIDSIFPHQFLCIIMVMMSIFFDSAYYRLVESQEIATRLWSNLAVS